MKWSSSFDIRPSVPTRRSPVVSIHGVVASSQTIASKVGTQILENGGNAADAAVAVAAALNVTEPTSTGIGGDAFCLFYSARDKKVSGLNGSGRSPNELSLSHLRKLCPEIKTSTKSFPNSRSIHTVTVPGAAAAWLDTIEKFGSGNLTPAQILAPAIQLARQGYPVSPLTAKFWKYSEGILGSMPESRKAMLIDGHAPNPGEIIQLPDLAQTFETLAKEGRDGYYTGRIAQAIVNEVQQRGGVLTMDDLASHKSEFVTPIKVNYHGVDVYEIPPNGQGITALIALNILQQLNPESKTPLTLKDRDSVWHAMIESLRSAFADSKYYVADPSVIHDLPISELLSPKYAAHRAKELSLKKSNCGNFRHGSPKEFSDTVYFNIVDADGNACSFINSNYQGFGTGIVPKGCGFTLQNRGANFSLEEGHPNCIDGGKRPYHTIIPGMAVRSDSRELYAAFGVMGGFMQPQGHVQVLVNMIDFGMDPQAALDYPRFCLSGGDANGVVILEESIGDNVVADLKSKGHKVMISKGLDRSVFGRGQIIFWDSMQKVCWAGSDFRCDGAAIPASCVTNK
eukprot:TRINITY_DN20262_c0_g1_i1.p1 TRINITY_DN20262_c0_g1~~TRINITY_DN20262_c0_g1_i1.p1  ORF type:complete len:569 (-),score=71.06 TRINITY_DN20262_c0_g1_i1:27-1733(-)